MSQLAYYIWASLSGVRLGNHSLGLANMLGAGE